MCELMEAQGFSKHAEISLNVWNNDYGPAKASTSQDAGVSGCVHVIVLLDYSSVIDTRPSRQQCYSPNNSVKKCSV
ncbi:unnamed protein product [Pieris brassicae]|uniref:Uncharacterized protein n=1 Tax=Pieris brassicae TaxID=7116 RepID=A0A9P0U1D7_PIEBR|nr:unnamed protein product [Pieris brassicae]